MHIHMCMKINIIMYDNYICASIYMYIYINIYTSI